MDYFSASFSTAAADIADWAQEITGARPADLPCGIAAAEAGMALSPVGMTDPARSVERGEAVLSSMGWFALSIGPEAPDNGLAWYDALYFAAFSTPGFELSRDPLPAAYWQSPVGLTLCIGRRIERRPETLVPGIVEHPLVFTVHTTPDAPEEANAPAARPAHTETG